MTVDCYELAAEQLAICESFQITVKAKNRSHPITQLASCKAELTEYKQQQKNLSHVRQTDFKNCLKTVNDLVKPVLHGKVSSTMQIIYP